MNVLWNEVLNMVRKINFSRQLEEENSIWTVLKKSNLLM